MLFLKVALADAQRARAQLLKDDALDVTVRVQKDAQFIYFPLVKAVQGELVEREAQRMRSPKTLKEVLAAELSPAELDALIGSYDLVGAIAILDVPAALVPKEQLIAHAVLAAHKHVTTVLKKADKHGGEFRTQPLVYLAGEDTRETVVVESGARLLLDVEQVYFSVRLSTERLRIASLICPGERVLVLFSGAAPYPVIFAKHAAPKVIVAVEKNPLGHRYAQENVRLNRCSNIELFNADCADLSFLPGTFDRIVMMLPSHSTDFLSEALTKAQSGTVLHQYVFAQEHEVAAAFERSAAVCAAAGFHAELLAAVKAGHHAPYVYRYCLDVVVKNGAQ